MYVLVSLLFLFFFLVCSLEIKATYALGRNKLEPKMLFGLVKSCKEGKNIVLYFGCIQCFLSDVYAYGFVRIRYVTDK